MIYSIASASARPVSRTLATFTAAAFAVLLASPVVAQQPAPAAKPAAPAAKPAAPAAKPGQAQQPAPAQAAQAPIEQPTMIFSPWTKFCAKGQEAGAKQVCFIGKDGRLEDGRQMVSAVIIEPEGVDRKILRVTLPLGMQVPAGTRVMIDQGAPATGPYVVCIPNGCMADYEVNADIIGRLKKGQQLTVQGINITAQPVSLNLPLTDFAKAYDGPPTDPKAYEESQKKLQDELQKKAEDARQKLQGQQGQAPGKTQ